MESSDNRHLRNDSLPVVDLRLLSQSELFALSHCPSEDENDGNRQRNDNDYDDGVLIPKIDRSVFNESAGSRKQTYSRLRLAPSAAVAARRSQSQAPKPPDPDSLQIVELLKQLFASDTETPNRLDEYAGGLVAGDSAPEVDCKTAAALSISPSRGFPNEIVLGLLQQPDKDEVAEPKRGRPITNPLPDTVNSEPTKRKPEGESVSQELISQHPANPTLTASEAVVPVPGPPTDAVSNNPAKKIDSAPRFTNATLGGDGSGKGKGKRGRPRKIEGGPQQASVPSTKVKKVKKAAAVQREDLEKVNEAGEVVDLAVLSSLKDPFGEELRLRTQGLATEAELIDYLEGVAGDWGSLSRKKKVVLASLFGNSLPRGWKLQLCPKRRDGRTWLICRRYISPGGQQFASCNEVSSYLLASFKLQDEGQSESGPAHANIQEANLLFEDQKNVDGLASCSKVPDSSLLTDNREKSCFDEKTDLARQVVSSHTDLSRENSVVNDAVKFKEGKYQCQFCHDSFDDRSHYDSHAMQHMRNYAESNDTSQGLTSMPKTSDHVSSCISPTPSNMQKSVGNDEEKFPRLEADDKLYYGFLQGNLRSDTPSENHLEIDRAEAVSGTFVYGQREGFVSFSHEEKVTNICKSDKGQEIYGNQAKTSYLTNDELGKLDAHWPEMGFQSSDYTPFDVDIDLNSSYRDVVDDSRTYNASELSVSFDGKYDRIDPDAVSRMHQEEISKRSSTFMSPYKGEYAFSDSSVTNRKAAEAKEDKTSSGNYLCDQSENGQSFSFTNSMKIPSLSSMEKSCEIKVKNCWNDKASHASGSTDSGMDANVGQSALINRSSEQTFPLLNEVPRNSSNRTQELKLSRSFDFSLIYPSGTEKIQVVDNTPIMFTGTLWEQQKLAVQNQFRNNEMAPGSTQDSRSYRDNMSHIMWRTDGQNFQPSRLTDSSSAPVQMPSCFPNYNLLPDKDGYGYPSVGERFDDIIEFGMMGHGNNTKQQLQLQYDFLSAQGTSNSNNARGSTRYQDCDSFFLSSKEDTSLFSNPAASRHQTLTVCVWCQKEFYYQDVSTQMKPGSAGVMCATCQAKYFG